MPSTWSTSTSSVEPPPMSKIRAGPSPGSQQLVAAEHGQPRFFLRGDDIERDAGLVADPLGEIAAVDGPAACFGGDRRATAKHCGGAVFRRRSPSAATARSIASSDSLPLCDRPSPSRTIARKGVDDGEAALGRAGDQQAAIVGAEIDRAIGVAVRMPPLRAAWMPMARSAAVLVQQSRRAGDSLRHVVRPFYPWPPAKGRLTWARLITLMQVEGKFRQGRCRADRGVDSQAAAFYLARLA